MKLRILIWRELFERKNQLLTSFLAVLLGITVVVSIKNITYYSEKAVARELDALGANILVLPKSATLQDYYSADMGHDEELPEEYVTQLAVSGLEGLDNISPKLSGQVAISNGSRMTTCILTGILPKGEFQAKAAWQGAGIFSRPAGCGAVADLGGSEAQPAKETLTRKRVIETLNSNEALVGSEVAARLNVKENDRLDVRGRQFSIIALLPETGTVDDSRIFAHLHTVQDLLGKGAVVNAIEIVGCCQQISQGLVQKLNQALPDAKVVTVAQVVDTQIKTNKMMAGLSVVFIWIIILVGGASIANYMYANVYERRREVGTLMALGASQGMVVSMFVSKAALLGIAGGIGGFALGSALATILGPRIAGVTVLPMPTLLGWALILSTGIAIAASLLPARNAARLDPCATLQEG